MSTRSSLPYKVFTLIELLVVIAIIAILAAMLLPSLSKARDTAKTSSCQSRMKQLALGVEMYSNDYDNWLPAAGQAADWQTEIAPYVGINRNNIGLSDQEAINLITSGPIFYCPSVSEKIKNLCLLITGMGWNQWNLGFGEDYPTVVIYRLRVKTSEIPNPSQTIEFGDTSDYPDAWWCNLYLYSPEYESSGLYLTPRHGNGLNMTYADGHCVGENIQYLRSNPKLYLKDK